MFGGQAVGGKAQVLQAAGLVTVFMLWQNTKLLSMIILMADHMPSEPETQEEINRNIWNVGVWWMHFATFTRNLPQADLRLGSASLPALIQGYTALLRKLFLPVDDNPIWRQREWRLVPPKPERGKNFCTPNSRNYKWLSIGSLSRTGHPSLSQSPPQYGWLKINWLSVK